MSDFSLFSLFTAGLACMIPLATAYTKPVGDSPSGNPISEPGLNSIVPVGENFTVTWDPTTQGTVTLVLLKGPSTNAVPQYAIVEKIKNSGTYVWTPSKDLAPSDGATGYGIQLIVDATGQYQYTTQFGISNADYKPSSSSAAASATATSSDSWRSESWGTDSWGRPTAAGESWGSSSWASASSTWAAGFTSTTETANATVSALGAHNVTSATAPMVTGTASGYGNVTVVAPTGSMTVPSSLLTTASATAASSSVGGASATAASSSAVQTGAAAAVATSFAGLVVAAGVAVFAL